MEQDTPIFYDQPNWKNEEEYVAIKGLKNRELAWQFLRRNPAYREDYKNYEELYKQDASKGNDLEIILCDKYDLAVRPGGLGYNLGLTDPQYNGPAPLFKVEDKPGTPVILRRWPTPEKPQKYNNEPDVPWAPCIDFRLYAHEPFDLQAIRLKKIFNSFTKSCVQKVKETRRQPDAVYIEYLRILDGLSSDASLIEIAEHLGGATNHKNVLYDTFRKKSDRAKRIMEKDYSDIAANLPHR